MNKNMKTSLIIVGLVLSIVLLAGCEKQPGPIVGNDTDEHGCKGSAGYSWCEAKQKCLRTFEENCTKECGTCPQLVAPAPDWCKDGTIQAGVKDECGCQGPPKCLKACTEEAKLCPDGSAVGRVGPNCEFAPCPNETNRTNGTGIANPASVYCENTGGTLDIRVDEENEGQIGICVFPDGTEWEEWAYYRGECPEAETNTSAGSTGGNNGSVGLANPASVYCERHGGTVELRVDPANEGQIGICILPGGVECEEWAYYRGECPIE